MRQHARVRQQVFIRHVKQKQRRIPVRPSTVWLCPARTIVLKVVRPDLRDQLRILVTMRNVYT